ncbi:hypothetical protein HMSSN036_96740 [Paenibacillus macerans]|nr:hypothetical protein HMSSN036_96740 [Paenibacillus macerans]
MCGLLVTAEGLLSDEEGSEFKSTESNRISLIESGSAKDCSSATALIVSRSVITID